MQSCGEQQLCTESCLAPDYSHRRTRGEVVEQAKLLVHNNYNIYIQGFRRNIFKKLFMVLASGTMSLQLLCRIMDDKLSEISLQPLTKSSEETVVAHEQAELEQASQGDQEQKKGRNRLGRWVSPKGKSVFIAVTTILGYLLVYFAIAVIQPFYPIWVSLTTNVPAS